MTLSRALREAAEGTLPDGWLYLADTGTPTAESRCLLLLDEELVEAGDASDLPLATENAEYRVEGLDTATLQDTAAVAQQYMAPPSDALLVESFVYYLRFDAFLPCPGAPDPPSVDHLREFYEGLGEERSAVSCRHQGCPRGAVELSVFCRVHHFENVRLQPCPFSD